MRRIRKLLDVPPAERRLLVKAALLLAGVRAGLGILPFQGARSLIERLSRRSDRLARNRASLEQLVWAVEVVARVVPGGGHCLSKAITAQILLLRRGHPAEVRYGAVRQTADDFIAHAWLESEGRVVIGGDNLDRYATLSPRRNSPK